MTDPYTYTEQAITRREEAARAARDAELYKDGRWASLGPGEYDSGSLHSEAGEDILGEEESIPFLIVRHIALHDPAAVLRCCAADRKILERHAECGSGSGYCDDGGHAREGDLACPDLLDLAAGYGWTPDA